MNVNDVEGRVIKCIKDSDFGLENEEISLDNKLSEDLWFDSLDYVELAMALEKEFEVSILDAEIDNWKTVRDVVSNIEKHLQ